MTDAPPPDRESSHGTPRWVKVFAIIILLILLVVAVMLIGGHSPGAHTP